MWKKTPRPDSVQVGTVSLQIAICYKSIILAIKPHSGSICFFSVKFPVYCFKSNLKKAI